MITAVKQRFLCVVTTLFHFLFIFSISLRCGHQYYFRKLFLCLVYIAEAHSWTSDPVFHLRHAFICNADMDEYVSGILP